MKRVELKLEDLNVESFEVTLDLSAGTNAQYTDKDHC